MQDNHPRVHSRLHRLTQRLPLYSARPAKTPSAQDQTRALLADLDRLRRADDALPENQADNARVAAILRDSPALPYAAGMTRRPISLQSVPGPLSKEEQRCLSKMREWSWGRRSAGEDSTNKIAGVSERGVPVKRVASERRVGAEPSSSSSSRGSESGASAPSSRSSRFIEHICDDEGIVSPPSDFVPPRRECLGHSLRAEGGERGNVLRHEKTCNASRRDDSRDESIGMRHVMRYNACANAN